MRARNKALWTLSASLILTGVLITLGLSRVIVYAVEHSTNLPFTYYEFDEKEDYPISDAKVSLKKNPLGKLIIKGDFKAQETGEYYVQNGNIDLSYSVNVDALESAAEKWHLTEDKSKKINDIKLDEDILKGVIIVQSSRDRKTWIIEKVYTDVFSENGKLPETIFTTKELQQLNGCYLRIIIAYKLEKKVDSSKILVWNKENFEYMKAAEVYEFKVIDQHTIDHGVASSSSKPRREFSLVFNTGKNNGYDASQAKPMDKDDPHFNKSIGYFTVNGFTRETTEKDGTTVFLKTHGDEVNLWFVLNEDIKKLFGKENLSICEDKKGYDKAMSVEPTNFKHGALIVKYTDEEGHSPETIKYFDFLAANAMTGADTKIKLYEEGEYEVTLNYRIKDSKGINSNYDYKMNFKFAIRNGNTMAFPRDARTGSELKNGALTEHGFTVDLAESKYLTIDILRKEVNQNVDGTISAIVRENTVAKNGARYSKQGLYEITVKNLYSDSNPTTITLFVGSDKNIAALSINRLSIEQLNELIKNGIIVDDDGSLINPSNVSVPNLDLPDETQTDELEPTNVPETSTEISIQPRPKPNQDNIILPSKDTPILNMSLLAPIAILTVVIVGLLVFVFMRKRMKKEEQL